MYVHFRYVNRVSPDNRHLMGKIISVVDKVPSVTIFPICVFFCDISTLYNLVD